MPIAPLQVCRLQNLLVHVAGLLQATWAHAWLTSHANINSMQPGWTYMFEAIYKDNTLVIQYPFQGLVLLGAVSPEGCELPDTAARAELAQRLGVTPVPSIHGSCDELLQRLGDGCFKLANNQAGYTKHSFSNRHVSQVSTTESRPATFEGWVLQGGDSHRCKLVQLSFKQTGHLAKHALHPLVVWDAVYRGVGRGTILKGLPSHYQVEADAILTALNHQFWRVQALLQEEVERTWLAQGCMAGNASAAATAAAPAAAPVAALEQQLAGLALSTSAAGEAMPVWASSSASTGETAAMKLSAAFRDAVQYAISKDTHFVSSLFKSDKTAPGLRGLILECIRPSTDGSIPGYTPSPAFKQTYAKGWMKGPQQGRMSASAPAPLILQKLTNEAAMCVLSKLPVRRMGVGNAMLVCRAWRRLITGDPGFKAQAEQWEKVTQQAHEASIRHARVQL